MAASDKWNSLLETLGVPPGEAAAKAEVTPATSADAPDPAAPPARPQPAAMLPAKAKPAPKPKPGPPAAKSPSYWSRIAGALGLEGAAAPEPEPEPKPIPQPPERRPAERRPAEQPRGTPFPPAMDMPPPRESSRTSEPRVRPSTQAPSRSPSDEMFEPRSAGPIGFQSSEQEEAPRVREPGGPRSRNLDERDLDERGSVLEFDRDENADLPLGARSGRDEAGAERLKDTEGDARRPRRRRGRRGRGDEPRGRGDEPRARGVERGAGPPPVDQDIEPSGEEMDLNLDYEREEDITADAPEGFGRHEERPRRDESPPYAPRQDRDEEQGRGGRGRHRGRGGRTREPGASERGASERGAGERGAGERGAGERGAGERAPGYGRREELPPREGRAAPPARGAEYDDELDDHDRHDLHAEMDEHDEDDSEQSLGVSHKKIPTWEEAVNVLIDANMSQRAANPDRPRGGGGGGGRGRGRGRGR